MAIRLICDRCGESSPEKPEQGHVTVARFTMDIAVSNPFSIKALPHPDGHLCRVCFEQILDMIRAALNSKRT